MRAIAMVVATRRVPNGIQRAPVLGMTCLTSLPRIELRPYVDVCSFVFEDQPGVGDWAGAAGWISWVDDAVSDAGFARSGDGFGETGGGDADCFDDESSVCASGCSEYCVADGGAVSGEAGGGGGG